MHSLEEQAAFYEDMKKFFVNYFKQIALVFGGAWERPQIQHQDATAFRAFTA